MNISIILAHPSPASFHHAIAWTTLAELERLGHAVILHDLYAEAFDPILPAAEIAEDAALPQVIARHCAEIAAADGIIIVHPNWWGQPPALLKGWIDRVLRPGVTYRFLDGDNGEGVPVGLLRAQAALVFNTSNTTEARENTIFGDPLDNLWKTCIFEFCGVPVVRREMFRVVVTSSEEQRREWLQQVRQAVDEAFSVDQAGHLLYTRHVGGNTMILARDDAAQVFRLLGALQFYAKRARGIAAGRDIPG